MLEWIVWEYLKAHNSDNTFVQDECLLETGHHVLNDPRSCDDCDGNACGNRKENFKLYNNVPVACFDIENFLSTIDRLHIRSIHDRCDMILADQKEKIALCELTCSMGKYIEPYNHVKKGMQPGKRRKAYQQMNSVLSELMLVPQIAEHILHYPKRVMLFCYRAKDVQVGNISEGRKKAIDSMASFTTPMFSISGLHTDLPNGFKFVQVRYPDEYVW